MSSAIDSRGFIVGNFVPTDAGALSGARVVKQFDGTKEGQGPDGEDATIKYSLILYNDSKRPKDDVDGSWVYLEGYVDENDKTKVNYKRFVWGGTYDISDYSGKDMYCLKKTRMYRWYCKNHPDGDSACGMNQSPYVAPCGFATNGQKGLKRDVNLLRWSKYTRKGESVYQSYKESVNSDFVILNIIKENGTFSAPNFKADFFDDYNFD